MKRILLASAVTLLAVPLILWIFGVPLFEMRAKTSSVVEFKPLGENIRRLITFGQVAIRQIVDARKNSAYPKAGASIVPQRLQTLAMDFVVLLGGEQCKDYRYVEHRAMEVRSQRVDRGRKVSPAGGWVVDACGQRREFVIIPRECDVHGGGSAIAVAPNHQGDGPAFRLNVRSAS